MNQSLRAAALLALTVAAQPLRAQSNTAEMLQRAIRLYEEVEIEQSLVILRQIISPQSPYVVSPEQRVEAYKYLGAALALQAGPAKRDSAITFFRAALERDPFTDLDPRTFSPVQVQVFSTARDRTFAVGLKPTATDTLDPRTERLRLRALTSHRGQLRVELRSGGVVRRVIFDGANAGLREIDWDALLADGRLVPAGRYEIVALGASHLITRPDTLRDSTRVFIELVHLHEPLTDTLPVLQGTDLLPEEHPASAAASDLLKGVAAAGGAILMQTVLSSGELGRGSSGSVVAGAGVGVGVIAFFARQRNRSIPANIAENARRQAAREQRNTTIRAANADILRETRLVVLPAAGVGVAP
jgi:hypothetical protein